jgi:hypothetical protein
LLSSTSRAVGCNEEVECTSCNEESKCLYYQGYAEGSSIGGQYWEDYVFFGEEFEEKEKFKFGCHNRETNLFKT